MKHFYTLVPSNITINICQVKGELIMFLASINMRRQFFYSTYYTKCQTAPCSQTKTKSWKITLPSVEALTILYFLLFYSILVRSVKKYF